MTAQEKRERFRHMNPSEAKANGEWEDYVKWAKTLSPYKLKATITERLNAYEVKEN